MRMSDLLKNLRKKMGKKACRRNTSNQGAASPHYRPESLCSSIFRWLFSIGGDVKGGATAQSIYSCLVPLKSSCCQNVEEKGGPPPVDAKETIPSMVDSINGEKKLDALSFNLGLGTGLVFLLAKSASEFNKMAELRSEMELVIKYIKTEIQGKALTSDLTESNLHSFPITNYCGKEWSNKLNNDAESFNFTVDYRQPSWHSDLDFKMCLEGNEMEQELQSELRRLHINFEGQDSPMHPHQARLKAYRGESFNGMYRQADEPNNNSDEANKQIGVCPRELERRLYELREARQNERISELENALECAEKKLNEKEMEICWWKDTAKLVSMHREERLKQQL